MSQQHTHVAHESIEAITQLSTGVSRGAVAISILNDLAESKGLTDTQVRQLTMLVSRYGVTTSVPHCTIEAKHVELADSRPGVAAHPAIVYRVTPQKEITVANFLKSYLGEKDASEIILGLADKINFNQNVPSNSEITLFKDSTHKPRVKSEDGRKANAETQQADLENSGYKFADDLSSLIVIAAIHGKARDLKISLETAQNCAHKDSVKSLGEKAGSISLEELTLLSCLSSGVIYNRWGALTSAYVNAESLQFSLSDGSLSVSTEFQTPHYKGWGGHYSVGNLKAK